MVKKMYLIYVNIYWKPWNVDHLRSNYCDSQSNKMNFKRNVLEVIALFILQKEKHFKTQQKQLAKMCKCQHLLEKRLKMNII